MASEYDLRAKGKGRQKHGVIEGAAGDAAAKRRKSVEGRVSFELPERFRYGDDADVDVTAPKTKDPRYTNQSVFNLIAKAGSMIDLPSRFKYDEFSESEEEGEVESRKRVGKGEEAREDKIAGDGKASSHRRKVSADKLLRPFNKLRGMKGPKGKKAAGKDLMSSSMILPEQSAEDEEAQAAAAAQDLETRPSLEQPGDSSGQAQTAERTGKELAKKIKDIFQLQQQEAVVTEYRCWLLQTVLLEGYMYITPKHICFYAYLPKKNNEVTKSGHLTKRGRSGRWTRSWYILKGDVLAYYDDPSDLYFPRGRINLRYAESAALSEPKEKDREPMEFKVTTDQKTHTIKADSAESAKEWVRALKKIIFRSHNEGDSVKILLPLENVVDIEENRVLAFADTVKIRVIDNDESFAVDDYFFSFSGSDGQKAMGVMQSLVGAESTRSNRASSSASSRHQAPLSESPPAAGTVARGRSRRSLQSKVLEPVRATLSPRSTSREGSSNSPRSDESRRHSSSERRWSPNRQRYSFSPSRNQRVTSWGSEAAHSHSGSTAAHGHRESMGSTSISTMESSNPAIQSLDTTESSASQILNRSDVFHRSGAAHHTLVESSAESSERNSQDTARSVDLGMARPAYDKRSKTEQTISTKRSGATLQQRDVPGDLAGSPDSAQASGSSYGLQGLVSAGTYPLQKASGFAGFLRKGSKRIGTLLTTDSTSYIGKVSGMWAGDKKDYADQFGLSPEDEVRERVDDKDAAIDNARFREHFALPESEKLRVTYYASMYRVLPLYGKIYISDKYFCFRSLIIGTRTKLVLPIRDIENVNKEKGIRFTYHGIVVTVRGHEELFFEFHRSDLRDDCAVTVHHALETTRELQASGMLSQESLLKAEAAKAEHAILTESCEKDDIVRDFKGLSLEPEGPPVIFDDPHASILDFTPREPLRITCLTIGSRGDVQPYIALCKGLIEDGHKPRIATHAEFGPWVESHGIEFSPIGGDPAELMRLCVETGMFTPTFLREASTKFRGWLDELFNSAWHACQGSQLLIESPSTMCGVHIAEALRIPYFRAFTMPWTRTRAYPHAFAVPSHKMGGAYNYYTYVIFDNVFWEAIAGQVNRWRRKQLNLPPTRLKRLQLNKRPFLYNFSPSVVPPPLDYSDWIRVTGYWFLDEGDNYQPSKALADFIAKARADEKPLVYIGFGSIVVEDSKALTQTVVEAVVKADVRCILSKGWSDRMDKETAGKPEVPLPSDILQIPGAPHDWLFKQVDAVAHHGGSGTTGASLRAGVPTIIKPFFGDQFFYGQRVRDLGVGIEITKMNTSTFARALWLATRDDRMIKRAKTLGTQIRAENGVATAIKALYRDMDYAESLIPTSSQPDAAQDLASDVEEEWTWIGGDEEDGDDPCVSRRESAVEPFCEAASAMERWNQMQAADHLSSAARPHRTRTDSAPIDIPRAGDGGRGA